MPLRRQLGTALAFIILAAGAAGCQRANPQKAKVVVVFVDVSGSVRDLAVYREAWPKIVDRMSGGDRLVLGRISDETYTAFRPTVDKELPVFRYLTDNKLRYEKQLKEIQQEVVVSLEKALAAPRSPKTDVMNSLGLAEKIYGTDSRRRVLVILSDMLEDSAEYNFERVKITDHFTKRVIESRRERGQVPDLGGAVVYVAGASARTAAKAQDVQRFWIEYMKAANARLSAADYGPALVNFAE